MGLTLKQIQELQKSPFGQSLTLSQVQGTPQPKEPGIVQSIAQGIASPFLRLAASGKAIVQGGANLAQAGIAAIKGDTAGVKKNVQEGVESMGPIDAGYLGKANVIGRGEEGEQLSGGRTIADVVGVGTELASDIVGGIGVKDIAKASLKGLVKEGAKRGAISGLKSGLLYGLGSSLQDEAEITEKDFSKRVTDVATDTALSALVGTVGGAVLGGVAPLPKAGIEKFKEFRNVESLQNKIADQYRKALNLTTSQLGIEKRGGKDTAFFLAKEGVDLNVIKGKLDADEALAQLGQKAELENNAFERLLIDDGGYINLTKANRVAKEAITELGSARETAKAKIDKEFVALVSQFKSVARRDAFGDIIVPKNVANKFKQDFWSKSKFHFLSTPAEKTEAGASRLAGRALKKEIEDSTEDAAIKEMSERLGDFAEAAYILNTKNGAPVQGGRLGRFFARIIGATAGAKGGPVGSVLGAMTADQVVDILQSPKTTTYAAKALLLRLQNEGKQDIVEQVEQIIQKRGLERAARFLLTAPKEKIINQGMPIILPAPTTFESKAANIKYLSPEESIIPVRQGAVKATPKGKPIQDIIKGRNEFDQALIKAFKK